jgi:hypothetical protein
MKRASRAVPRGPVTETGRTGTLSHAVGAAARAADSHRLVIEPHRPADRLGHAVVDVAFLLLLLAAASILATLVVLIIVLG